MLDPTPGTLLRGARARLEPLLRWAPILPLLFAEFILWTGFGALLPVMPLYLSEHGVDVRLLGVVIAAWPAARLVAEPLFGAVADRTARVPLMVLGLVIAAGAVGAMAIFTTPLAFIALRALSGLGTAIYDPAARGYLTEAAPKGRTGEVFGLYSAAQMGGILLGPAIGGIGTALVGGYAFVLAFGAVTTFAAAIAVAARVREIRDERGRAVPAATFGDLPPAVEVSDVGLATPPGPGHRAPATLRNRFLAAAVLINLAGYFGGGLYETIWALFVTDRGGSVELIGVSFAVFGLTTIVLSPIGGRTIDRQGPYRWVIIGSLLTAGMMALYPVVTEPLLYLPMVAVEAVGFAFVGPATYAIIARGTPPDRSSTAQGIAGAAGTIGTIVASIAAGLLAAIHIDIPFFAGAAVVMLLLAVTLAVGGGALRSMAPARAAAAPA